MIAFAKAIGYGRARFDRSEQLRVQPQPTTMVRTDRRAVRAERCSLGNARVMIRLTSRSKTAVTRLFCDMKVCHITGSRAVRGSVIHRRGLAKKKGGVGRHITKMVPRVFAPNLRANVFGYPN
jgi:hypothetical protein